MIDPITQYILENQRSNITTEIDELIMPFTEYQLLSEELKNFKINAIAEHVRNRLNKSIDILKRFGINTTELMKKGKAYLLPKIEKYYKQGMVPKKAATEILKGLAKLILSYLKKAAKKVKELNLAAKLALGLITALAIIGLVFVINTAILTFMTSTMGFAMWDAFRISAIVLGPFVEEAMKTVFISLGMGYTATVLFSGIESVMQGVIWTSQIANPSFIVSRVITTVMHLLTVRAQKDSAEKSKKDKDATAKRLFHMWLSGVVIHCLANAIVLYKNEDMYRTLFDPTYWKHYLAPLFT